MIEYQAAAKINLALHVTARRDDGYHCLDTLVTFAKYGDLIQVEPDKVISLTIDGPFAEALGNKTDNLVLKAARLLQYTANENGIATLGAAIHLTSACQ